MRVVVLLGGDSAERDVSLRSGAAVSAALERVGHDVVQFDPAEGLDRLAQVTEGADCVLPILHGTGGEDGVIQKELEKIGVPYLGSESGPSALAYDKQRAHEALEQAGVTMPRYEVVNKESFHASGLISAPYVLKPVDQGSSVGLVVARTHSQQDAQRALALLETYPTMLLEELIDGQEITVPVLGDKALPVIAITPPVDGEFDYKNKYNGATQELCPVPASVVSDELQKKAQEIALHVHRVLDARHISRTDMIVQPDGRIVVLELNTLPGMTDQSLVPKSAAAAGISMDELADRFVTMAMHG